MKMPVPFSSYGSTRLVADTQKRLNVYSNSRRGVRQFPGLVEFTGFTSPSRDSETLTNAYMEGKTSWNLDGTKFFGVKVSSANLGEFAVSTPYDVSTATFTDASNGFGAGNVARGGIFNKDGTKYFQPYTTGIIKSITFSAAFDVSTGGSVSGTIYDFSSEITGTNFALAWSSDGFKMYIVSFNDQAIFQYTLTSPYDPSTATYSSVSLSITSETTATSGGITVDPNGRNLFIPAGGTDNNVHQYFMSAVDDLSTAGSVGTFNPTHPTSTVVATLSFNGDGTKAYIPRATSSPTAICYVYSLGASYSLADGATQSGAARCAEVMDGVPYVVLGSSLYSISSTGAATLLGAIVGSDSVGMSTDGTNLVVTAAGTKYNYTVAGGLVTITDSDLGNAYTSAYLDLRTYYDQPGGKFAASAQQDPTSLNALDFATAESFNDDVLNVFGHNQILYVCGEKTIEPHLSSGVGRPPVDRQVVIQRGLIGRRAINSIDNTIYFVDDTRRPNRMMGFEYAPIYTPALGQEWDSYTTVSDCIVNTYAFEQENFAEFFFPTQDVTWTYHENSQQWSKRQDSSATAYRVAYYVKAYGKVLGVDRTNGKVYSLSTTTYQDDSASITRTIDSDLITSELYEVEGLNMIASELTLTVSAETGGGTIDISFTTNPADLTPTFTTVRSITLVAGTQVIDETRWGRFREGVFRITTTSNDKVEFIDAALDVELLDG